MRWIASIMSAAALTSSSRRSSTSSSTVIVGLNAALQKRLLLCDDTLTPGRVHRAERVTYGLGGKGQDVAYTLHCLHYYHAENNSENDASPSHSLRLAQFLGRGAAGDLVHELWQTLFRETMDETETDRQWLQVDDSVTIRTQGPLRTCTSVVTATATTELVEPSSIVSDAEWTELITALTMTSTATTAVPAAVAIMGSMPPGCPPDAYAQIYRQLKTQHGHNNNNNNTLCLIDSVVGLDTLLPMVAKDASTQCLLKINVEELCRLVGLESSEDDGPLEVMLPQAMALLLQKYHLETVASSRLALALTNGRNPAYLALWNDQNGNGDVPRNDAGAGPPQPTWTLYQLPVVTQLETMPLSDLELSSSLNHKRVLYPIGAGDAVAAGTLAAWHYLHTTTRNNQSLPRLVRTALDQRVVETATTLNGSDHVKSLLVAMAFGLACGSASCLHEENSKVHLAYVLQLFDCTPLPIRLTTTTSAAVAAAEAR
jgi:fructose-1-phosphate kinase PfkB-like protein